MIGRTLLRQRGFGLIEVVIGSALLLVLLVSITAVAQQSLQALRETKRQVQAELLLREGFEALRMVRDISWTNISTLSTGTSYGLSLQGGVWGVAGSSQQIDIFTRSFTLDPVYRDGSWNIASSGTNDPDARKVTMRVVYEAPSGTVTRELSAYYANIQ